MSLYAFLSLCDPPLLLGLLIFVALPLCLAPRLFVCLIPVPTVQMLRTLVRAGAGKVLSEPVNIQHDIGGRGRRSSAGLGESQDGPAFVDA